MRTYRRALIDCFDIVLYPNAEDLRAHPNDPRDPDPDSWARASSLANLVIPHVTKAFRALTGVVTSSSGAAKTMTAADLEGTVGNLIPTLDTSRPLPAFLSSKHVSRRGLS